MDLSPILALFKGKDAENFKAVVNAYKELYDELRKEMVDIKTEINQVRIENEALKQQLIKVTGMEERCLDQNVKANELIRNLAEWIIFVEKREQIKLNMREILK